MLATRPAPPIGGRYSAPGGWGGWPLKIFPSHDGLSRQIWLLFLSYCVRACRRSPKLGRWEGTPLALRWGMTDPQKHPTPQHVLAHQIALLYAKPFGRK